jgi:hypothetical protein
MSNYLRYLKRYSLYLAGCIGVLAACSSVADLTKNEPTSQTAQAVGGGAGSDPVPCAAWAAGIVANTGSLIVNAGTLIDSYSSSNGPYGGSNVGTGVVVQAGTTITNNGGTIRGIVRPNEPGGFSVVPVPAGAANLPLASSTPGSVNINGASDSITLAPGDYVASNINVNFPGAINVSPAGQVRIWVTGTLNLGGNENLNGVPSNLAFLVTSSGFVNVNSRGSLFGMIYAPTSSVNVDSSIFGSVVGSTVSVLNSGGALHFDQSSLCVGATSTNIPPGGLDPLPPPPAQVGCFEGTLNGWLQIPCQDPKAVINGFQNFDVSAQGLETPLSGTVPLAYGQVESTVESLTAENGFTPIGCNKGSNCADGVACPGSGVCACNAKTCLTSCDSAGRCEAANQWGIQLNSNWFNCPAPVTGLCWDQFVVTTDGIGGDTAVCIETWQNGQASWNDQNFCVGVNGQQSSVGGNLSSAVTTRKGPLVAGDFGNVAAYAYTAKGAALIGMVAQFSWVSSQDVQAQSETALPNRIPGLYAVVTPDQYGLANSWTNVAGGMMGMDNKALANFTNAEVLQRYAVSDCQNDVSAGGPTCPSAVPLTSSNVTVQPDSTSAETNNLFLVPSPSVSFPNANLAVTEVFGSTSNSGGNGTCLTGESSHIFMRDNEGDNGGTPSNTGGVPFWESPDIFVVPVGANPPLVTDTPPDVNVTAGGAYNVWLRVHNDGACSDVQGPINVFIDVATPDIGFANWQPVTTGADSGQYVTFGAGQTIAKANQAGMVGPFPFMPKGTGHQCILAAIAGPNETEPPASGNAPVLPPAYSSNQIAQRNLQIGSTCSYNITNTNTTSANLTFGISVTPGAPAPGAVGGPGVSLVFGDSGGVWSALWTGAPGLSSVSNDGTNTTIVLNSSYVGLPAVPLADSTSPSVTVNISTSSSTPPTVNVSAILVDPQTGNILQANGGSCTGTKQIVIPIP